MTSVDFLSAARVEELVRLAGGTARVAELLGLEEAVVVRWHFEGLDEPLWAVGLENLVEERLRARGRPRRSTLMEPDDIKSLVAHLGGVPRVSARLALHPRTLRRYVRGDIAPPTEVVARLRGLSATLGAPRLRERRMVSASKERLGRVRGIIPPSLTLPLL